MWWSWPQSGVWWWLQSGILVMAGCFQTIRKDLAHPQERRCQSDYARLQSVIISLLITFHSDWRYGCYDCCDSGDAENQHSLFDIELIATVSFDYVDWMAKSKKKKVFDSELNVIVFIGPESDHWECLSVTNSLTDSLLFSKLDWWDPYVWRCQIKTCWGCYCCWCRWWG